MQLEDYFVFESMPSPIFAEGIERIYLKEKRIAIEHVLYLHQQGIRPEEIVEKHYPVLALDEVYATILFYLCNKARVEEYLRRGDAVDQAMYQAYLSQDVLPVAQRLRELREEPRTNSPAPQK